MIFSYIYCDFWYLYDMLNRNIKDRREGEKAIVPWWNCVLRVSLCGLGGLQHFAILLKYIIHVAIPDIPGWVAEEMAKLEYRRREAFKV